MSTAVLEQSPVIDLTSHCEYQRGGIVSRILLKQASGNMTLFAFDAGQAMSEHTCPYDALLHVTEGKGVVTIGGTDHLVLAGQMIKLPAHIPHAVAAQHRFKMLLTIFRPTNDTR
jgi:quercetin dioxygenase-like cupin family protein